VWELGILVCVCMHAFVVQSFVRVCVWERGTFTCICSCVQPKKLNSQKPALEQHVRADRDAKASCTEQQHAHIYMLRQLHTYTCRHTFYGDPWSQSVHKSAWYSCTKHAHTQKHTRTNIPYIHACAYTLQSGHRPSEPCAATASARCSGITWLTSGLLRRALS
jgi:hypothetical protein